MATANQGMSAQQQQLTAAQINLQQRSMVLSNGVDMSQQIFAETIASPTQSPTVTVQPRPVGLIKKFRLRMTALVTNTSGGTISLTDFGLSNLLSNIQFTDIQNNVRINTSGWHLSFVNSMKYGVPFAGGFALETDSMGGYGETFPILAAPATIATSSSATIAAMYEIPLAYSENDLRGAMFANVNNAVAQLVFTINPQPVTAAGTDSTLAIYKGGTGTLTNVTFELYQDYIDQLPIGQGGYVLPTLDLATIYELKMSNFNNISPGQDFPVNYANARSFLSTFAVYNHDTTVDTGRGVGADINYWGVQAANMVFTQKQSPLVQSMLTRQILRTDLPKGSYYFPFRNKPIQTQQFGNVQLILNAITATNPLLLIGWEDFAIQNVVNQSASLPG